MALRYRFEAMFDDEWVSLDADFVREDGFSVGRGIRGNSPTDVLADPGQAVFALDNTSENEGGIESWYTLGHPDCRAGWDYGTPIRFVLERNDVVHERWTGKLENVLAEPFPTGLRAHVIVGDIIHTLSEQEIRSVEPQHDKTEVELLDAALDSLPAESQPDTRDFDAAISQFTYAFHDLGGGANALGVLQKVLVSAQGFAWPLANGALHYENKVSRVLRTSRHHFINDFENIDVPSSLDNVFNRFRLTTHPKNDADDLVVIWANDGALAIEPGAVNVQQISATYRHPDNDEQLIGAFYIEPLDPGVDYEGNSAEDGSGDDLTASLTITMAPFASTADLTIENTGGQTVYIQGLQIRGKAIVDRSPLTREGYVPQSYPTRTLPMDLPYRDDDTDVQSDAAYLAASYSNRKKQATNLEFLALFGDDYEELACTLELGEAIEVTEPKNGLDQEGFFIQSIDYYADASGILMVLLGLAPRIVQDEPVDTEPTHLYDRLGTYEHDPVNTIGFMEIGFSEIG